MTAQLKTSDAFKQAKQCLRPIGRAGFICHALAEAAFGRDACAAGFNWHNIYRTRKSGFNTAIKVITDRIGSGAPLENWLLDAHGVEVWRVNDKHKQMEAYRHRWLDALIVEFEAKGD